MPRDNLDSGSDDFNLPSDFKLHEATNPKPLSKDSGASEEGYPIDKKTKAKQGRPQGFDKPKLEPARVETTAVEQILSNMCTMIA